MKLQRKCENLEAKVFDFKKASNKQDQYTRQNNLEIHGILVDVKDEQLEQKVYHIFFTSKYQYQDCHQLGKSNTIVRFVNCKVCKDALEKKSEVNRLSDNSKLGFKREKNLSISENLTPYNQHLAWMCRELKRVKKFIIPGQTKELLNFDTF